MESKPWWQAYPDAARPFDLADMGPRTIPGLLDDAAANHGGRNVLTTMLPNGLSASITYEDLQRYSDQFAAYLRAELGLEPLDVVAIMAPNCIAFGVASMGALRAGCIATHVNPLYTAAEVKEQLSDSKAKVLVVADVFADKVNDIIGELSLKRIVTVSLLDFFPPVKRSVLGFLLKHLKRLVPTLRAEHETFRSALAAGRQQGPMDEVTLHPGDTALIQYTSGTTGPAKGVVLSHQAILANIYQAELMTKAARSPGVETFLVVLPLYHTTAYVLMFLGSLRSGSHGVLCPNPRPLKNLKPAFEKFGITWFIGIEMLFTALLKEDWFSVELIPKLRFCGSGGASQRVAGAEDFKQATGLEIHQGYGLTECAGLLTINPIGANRFGSVGVPMPGMDVRIIDENGNEADRGEPGEIIVHGPTLMTGYHGRPEETEKTIVAGWLHTGDIGIMNEDGFVEIVDRKSDIILVSGFNVSPNEVEDVICGVNGVAQAGVIGMPSDKTGEAPVAFVVRSDPAVTEQAILDACRSRLAAYKRPKRIHFVDELPVAPTGKVSRKSLRASTPAQG